MDYKDQTLQKPIKVIPQIMDYKDQTPTKADKSDTRR